MCEYLDFNTTDCQMIVCQKLISFFISFWCLVGGLRLDLITDEQSLQNCLNSVASNLIKLDLQGFTLLLCKLLCFETSYGIPMDHLFIYVPD